MNSKIKAGLIGGGGLVLGIIMGAAGGGGGSGTPAASSTPAPTVTVTAAAQPGPETTVTETVTETAQPAAVAQPSGDTCANAREALLTGSQKQITDALNALIGDKSADGTAREYAQYYLGRDKGQTDLQQLDVGLIRASCGG